MIKDRIIRTKAIVLKSQDYLETSKLVTLFTEKYGKITTIAKGYRRPKSQFGNSLEIFTIVDVVIYNKSTRNVQVVTQSSIIKQFDKISDELIFFAYCSAALELFNRLVIAQDSSSKEANMPLFSLLQDFLYFLESYKKESIKIFFFSFNLKLSALLGYLPNFEKCINCNNPVDDKYLLFDIEDGGILHKDCNLKSNTDHIIEISQGILKVINKLIEGNFESIKKIKIGMKTEHKIETMMNEFFRYHVQGYRDLKSLRFLRKITNR